MLSVIMLSVIMLSVLILSVIMLSDIIWILIVMMSVERHWKIFPVNKRSSLFVVPIIDKGTFFDSFETGGPML